MTEARVVWRVLGGGPYDKFGYLDFSVVETIFSTAWAVSVTRSTAAGWLSQEGLWGDPAMRVQFFLEPASPVVGRAVVIISAALWATEMRKSWISWRSRLAIFLFFWKF